MLCQAIHRCAFDLFARIVGVRKSTSVKSTTSYFCRPSKLRKNQQLSFWGDQLGGTKMSATSRRTLILSAALAGAALGLDRSLAIAAPARHQQTPDPTQGFFRYKVGDAECTAIYDGIWEKAHDPAFFSNATVAETKEALAAAGFTTAFVTIPITVFVIKLNDKLIMCDAGGGDQVQAFNPESVFVSGKLMANMKAAGIDPKKIETILISHFHPDHIFGLLEKKTNAPVFPDAEIIVPAAEYKWWTDPSIITRLPKGRRPLARRIQAVIPKWKNVLPVEGEDEVVPGIRFVSAPGHTPGHTAFHISSGNEQLMISSDAAYVPALCAEHPGWHGVFDQNAELAETSRRKLLDRVIADKMIICGSHFPWPGLGEIARDGAGYALTVHTT
jgi:glyoxylase-like metal-dependent hydrolase (beta-lactamase superfamily II)